MKGHWGPFGRLPGQVVDAIREATKGDWNWHTLETDNDGRWIIAKCYDEDDPEYFDLVVAKIEWVQATLKDNHMSIILGND